MTRLAAQRGALLHRLTTNGHSAHDLGDLLLDGGPADGRASTVLDLSRYEEGGGWQIMRAGEWGESEIAEMLTRRRDDLPTP